jgi:serine/threonine-protein kinase
MMGAVLDGRYKVIHKLGDGGSAEVYLAEHIHIGRREAIKVLRPEVAVDTTFVGRFRREARAINRLHHPNIIGIYDFGQLPDGRLYLAMEHAAGAGIDSILNDTGALDIERALYVLYQLASAAEHAHGKGVVHRDLKPSNMVLIEHRGNKDVLKILDFGIAKIVCSDETEELTKQGEIFGTPAYMAPESFTAMGSDPRSDIYSIGCIAYELLTGKPPFEGHRVQLMQAHMGDTPKPPTEANPDAGLPRGIDGIVLQCLEKTPETRFQSARDLANAIEQVPGFPGKRGRSSTAKLWLQSWTIESHEEVTHSSGGTPWSVGSGSSELGTADTAAARTSDVRAGVFQALLDLAERLLDAGVEGNQLTVSVAKVRALKDDIKRLESDKEALDEREARVEQNQREREGSLRFAIGELKFDRERSGGDQSDLDYQVDQLEERLVELLADTTVQLDEITEQGIEVVASMAKLEDNWDNTFTELQAAVKEAAEHVDPDDGDQVAMAARYQAIEMALEEVAAAEQGA